MRWGAATLSTTAGPMRERRPTVAPWRQRERRLRRVSVTQDRSWGAVEDLARAFTLPASAYIDEAVYAREQDRIFARTWQLVARADELSRVGDLKPATILDEPILISRGLDGKLRGFYNVCRHRAAQVVVAKMQLVERRDYVIECNWKVYVDNYLEGYHLPIAHPGLFKELDYDAYRVETFRYYSKQHAPIRELKPGEEPGRDRRYIRQPGTEEDALYYWVFPNTMFNIYQDNMSSNLILPLGVDKTLTVFEC